MKKKKANFDKQNRKMANENIIVKFQVEGADKFNKDIEKSADVILDVAKANKIADQSSDELAKSIGQTANQLQILGKEGKTSTDEFNKLNTSLKKIKYQATRKYLLVLQVCGQA